jgi:hypothetical protein
MTATLPASAVVRASRATFDPSRFAEVDALSTKQAEYLGPAVKALPGLIDFSAALAPNGQMLQVSIWDTEEHSAQLNTLKEMVVIARGEMEELGVSFTPITTYPVSWTISPRESVATEALPATTVARVARGSFDASLFGDIDALSKAQAEYLVPAVQQLPGLLHWYSGVASVGSILQVSIWDSEEHSDQMSRLKEMTVRARGEMTAAGVSFDPIVNLPISWTV